MGWPYPWNNVKDPLAIPGGALRHHITIQSPVSVNGIAGAETEYVYFADAMSLIEALRGNDQWRMGQFTSQKFVSIRLRWIAGVVSSMRVLFEGRVFVVQDAVDVQERKRVLQLLCVELDGK